MLMVVAEEEVVIVALLLLLLLLGFPFFPAPPRERAGMAMSNWHLFIYFSSSYSYETRARGRK